MAGQVMQTVVFDVSSHGVGHLGQMAPVVQTLIASYPETRVVIRSAHPDHVVHDFKGSPVELDRPSPGAMLISRDAAAKHSDLVSGDSTSAGFQRA